MVTPPPRLRDLPLALFRRFPGQCLLILAVLTLTTLLAVRVGAVEFPPERTPALPAGRWVICEMTAYCPNCAICQTTRTTANGTNTDRVPYNLAASRSLALGAQVYVPTGLGVLDVARSSQRTFTVDDRGGLVEAEANRYGVLRLDLRVKEHWWAKRFGRRLIPVYVIN